MVDKPAPTRWSCELFDDGDRDPAVAESSVQGGGGGGGGGCGGGGGAGGGGTGAHKAGEKVEAQFKGRGKHFPGKIRKVNGDGTYDVLFDDGDRDPAVAESTAWCWCV